MEAIKVFVISLKECSDRRAHIANQLTQQGIDFEFFDAVDGRKENHPLFERYDYIKRLWFTSGGMPPRGELGCYASHYLLWETCVKLGQSIVIIEDDAAICADAKTVLPIIQNRISCYGYLRLEDGSEGVHIPIEETEDYCIVKMTHNFNGTRAYAISPSAAKNLLLHSKKWSVAVDNFIGSFFLHGVESYLLTPFLAQDTGDFATSIQPEKSNKTPVYRKPTRELYRVYKDIRLFLHNWKFKLSLKN